MAKDNPWLALSTYEEKDKDKFRGREQDTANMLKMLQQNEYVVCYAASGDVKSSMINAGVCPAMRKLGYYPVKIVFSSDEFEGINVPRKEDNKINFDTFILRKIEELTSQLKFEVDDQFSSFPSTLSSNLWWKLRTQSVQIPFGEYDYIPVLIFDQFEEVLRAKWRNDFFSWLEELSADECPDYIYNQLSKHEVIPSQKKFKAIFSMRYEYVGELDYWCSQRHFIPQMMRSRYFLKPLSRSQALEIISKQELPTKLKEKFAKEATNILDNINKDTSTQIDSDEVPAVILSLVCHILYEKWSFDSDYPINSMGINTVIYEYYMEEIQSIGIPDLERRLIENALISAEGNRLRIHLSDSRLTSINFKTYIDKNRDKNLLSAHIIKMNEEYVEFTHDRLAESIIINKKEEDNKIKRISTYSKIRFASFFILFSSLITLCFVCAQKFKSTEIVANGDLQQSIEIQDSTVSQPIIINDINDNLVDYDWYNATSVELSSTIHACPNKQIYCYGNVILMNGNLRYASNSESLAFYFPFLKNINIGISLNKNVQDVYVLYPENLQFVLLSNPYTIIHVPYGSTYKCINNVAFQKVHFVEMSFFETLYERLKYEACTMHTHLFGVEEFTINSFFLGIILAFCLIIWFIKVRKAYMTKRSLAALVLLYVAMGVISTILYLELYCLDFNFGLTGFNIAIPLILIILVEGTRYLFDKKYSLYKDKAKVCIVYHSTEGKQFAQKLSNELILHKTFHESDILLDMTMLHHGQFKEEIFINHVSSVKNVIGIITDEDLSDESSDRYSFLLGKCKTLHPVLYTSKEPSIEQAETIIYKYRKTNTFQLEILGNDNGIGNLSRIYGSFVFPTNGLLKKIYDLCDRIDNSSFHPTKGLSIGCLVLYLGIWLIVGIVESVVTKEWVIAVYVSWIIIIILYGALFKKLYYLKKNKQLLYWNILIFISGLSSNILLTDSIDIAIYISASFQLIFNLGVYCITRFQLRKMKR